MWHPADNPLSCNPLGPLEPTEVLYEHDGEPLTFIAHTPGVEMLLAHSLCAFDRTSRYLVAAVDGQTLAHLKAGELDLLGALRQPRCWVADVAEDASVQTVWRVDHASIPEWLLPRLGVMLNPDLDRV